MFKISLLLPWGSVGGLCVGQVTFGVSVPPDLLQHVTGQRAGVGADPGLLPHLRVVLLQLAHHSGRAVRLHGYWPLGGR